MIFGSCVSRDILNLPNQMTLTKYYARSSFASIFQKPFDYFEIVNNLKSNFQKNIVKADMTKDILQELGKGEFDILLVDFIDERFDLFSSNNGLCTLSNEAVHSGILKEYPEHTVIRSGSAEFFKLWEEGWNNFIELLKKNGQLEKVFLNKVYWAKKTILGQNFEPTYHESKIDEMNIFLDKLYTIAERSLPPKNVMNFSKKLMLGADEHQWGLSPFHYINGYYKSAMHKLLQNNITKW